MPRHQCHAFSRPPHKLMIKHDKSVMHTHKTNAQTPAYKYRVQTKYTHIHTHTHTHTSQTAFELASTARQQTTAQAEVLQTFFFLTFPRKSDLLSLTCIYKSS